MPGTGDPIQRMLRQRAAELAGARGRPRSRRDHAAGDSSAERRRSARACCWPAPWPSALAASRRERRAQARQQARAGARVVIDRRRAGRLTCAYRLNQPASRRRSTRPATAGWAVAAGRCAASSTARSASTAASSSTPGTSTSCGSSTSSDWSSRIASRQSASIRTSTRPLWLNGQLRDRAAIIAGFDDLFAKLKADYKRVGDYHYNTASDAARAFDEMTALDWLNENVDDPLLREAGGHRPERVLRDRLRRG